MNKTPKNACFWFQKLIYYVDGDFFFGKMVAHPDFFENPLFSMIQPTGNTISYVDALASHFNDKVVLNSSIKSIQRNEDEVILKMEGGSEERFNRVVFACNADQVLKLLEKPTDQENKILGPWRYNDGPIVVHRDHSSFPKEYYSMFTCLYTSRNGKTDTSINGHIRSLKKIPDDCDIISSQYPNFPIDKDLIEYSKLFRTPIFEAESVDTIKDLPSLNGKMNSYYCGSHFGYGLHEDSVTSAVEVAKMLGVKWK